jgi:hypothetical protein
MISVAHFTAGTDDFEERARRALEVLAQQAGYRHGTLGRSTDDETAWVLVTEWLDVGSYRRALGAFAVKVEAAPLLGEAVDWPSSFETLVEAVAGQPAVAHGSDREPDAAGRADD